MDGSIPYDQMVQDALKGVVRQVLGDAARFGLGGDHHFYIAFKTHAPGVQIPDFLREKYPEEMTIVIQHRFWNLKAEPEYFEIELSFNQRRHRLVIPFAAVLGFVDPSVQFALQFVGAEEAAEAAALATARSALAEPAPEPASANVVTLDAFRKKP